MNRFSHSNSHSSPGRLRRQPPAGRYRYVRKRWHILFAVIDSLGAILLRATRYLSRRQTRDSAQPSTEDPRSILLVQLDHLGDAILTTAILPSLKSRFP